MTGFQVKKSSQKFPFQCSGAAALKQTLFHSFVSLLKRRALFLSSSQRFTLFSLYWCHRPRKEHSCDFTLKWINPFTADWFYRGWGEAKVKHALWTQHAAGCSLVNVSKKVSNNSAAVTSSICDPSSICGIALRWLIGEEQAGCWQQINQVCIK